MRIILSTLLVISAFVFHLKEAYADLTICNKYKNPMVVAMIYDNGFIPILAPNWLATGWFNIQPGACSKLVTSDSLIRAYLSIQLSLGDGKYYEPVYERDEPNPLSDTYSSGIKTFFCVNPNSAFRRSLKDIKDHQECPENYKLQLFNLYASVISGGHFKLTLE